MRTLPLLMAHLRHHTFGEIHPALRTPSASETTATTATTRVRRRLRPKPADPSTIGRSIELAGDRRGWSPPWRWGFLIGRGVLWKSSQGGVSISSRRGTMWWHVIDFSGQASRLALCSSLALVLIVDPHRTEYRKNRTVEGLSNSFALSMSDSARVTG